MRNYLFYNISWILNFMWLPMNFCYDCDFTYPQQYPIVLGGYTSSTVTSILTFVIEQTTNSIFIGGTSTSTDLTGQSGQQAIASYIDSSGRKKWFSSYPAFSAITSCDVDQSISPNKVWCLFVKPNYNIIIASISASSSGSLTSAYLIANTLQLDFKRNDVNLYFDQALQVLYVTYHPITSTAIVLARLNSAMTAVDWSKTVGQNSAVIGIRKMVVIGSYLYLGGMVQINIVEDRGALVKIDKSTGTFTSRLFIQGAITHIYLNDLVQMSSTKMATVFNAYYNLNDMSIGQNVNPTMLAVIDLSLMTVSATQYISIGSVNNAMVNVAYDSTNACIYVAYFHETKQSSTPIFFKFDQTTLFLIKATGLKWGSASFATQVTNTMIYNPLDGYLYASGFTDRVQGPTVLPNPFGFLSRYSFSSSIGTGTCQQTFDDLTSYYAAFSVTSVVTFYTIDAIQTLTLSAGSVTISSYGSIPTMTSLSTFNLAAQYQLCERPTLLSVPNQAYSVYAAQSVLINANYLTVSYLGNVCANVVIDSFVYKVNGVQLLATDSSPFKLTSTGLTIYTNKYSAVGLYSLELQVYIGQLLITETAKFTVTISFDATIFDSIIQQAIADAIKAAQAAIVVPTLAINTSAVAPQFNNWNLTLVELYDNQNVSVGLPSAYNPQSAILQVKLVINGTEQLSNQNFKLLDNSYVAIQGSKPLVGSLTKLGVILQESNTVEKLSSYQDFQVSVLSSDTKANDTTKNTSDSATNDTTFYYETEANLTAQITRIYKNYTVEVAFTLPIIVFPNYENFKTDQVILVQISGRNRRYQYDWNLIYMDPLKMLVQLQFENPNQIGIYNQPERVTVYFSTKSMFRDASNGMFLSTSYTSAYITSNVDPQNIQIKAAKAVAQVIKLSYGTSIAVSALASISMSFGMQFVWSLLNTIQILAILPLLKPVFPSFLNTFFTDINMFNIIFFNLSSKINSALNLQPISTDDPPDEYQIIDIFYKQYFDCLPYYNRKAFYVFTMIFSFNQHFQDQHDLTLTMC